MKVQSSLCVFASLLFTFTVTDAQLAGSWPPLDKPPPPTKEFTDLVDLTKVSKAPVVKTVGDCPAQDTFCNWSCTGCTRNASDIIKCPKKGDWGITFDDGPTPFTSTLMDFLDKDNNPDGSATKVTFFVVGSRVVENPEILKRAVDSGHQIGVHTWSHPYLTSRSNEDIIAEIKWTEAAIKAAVGVTPKYMRPPYGDCDDRVRGIATQLGYKVVIWDKDTDDWESADDKSFQLDWIEGNFTEWVKEPSKTGHISLEHDLYEQTAARATLVVPIVQGAGFNIKPVASCLNDPRPYLEDTPTSTANVTSTQQPLATPSADASPTVVPSPSPDDTTGTTDTSVSDSNTSNKPDPTSNAISFTKDNNGFLLLVSLIMGFFMII